MGRLRGEREGPAADAGELCERVDRLHLVRGDVVLDVVPTYRGEGQSFL